MTNVTKEVTFSTNNREYVLVCKDPYGFWYITTPGKTLPSKLTGTFTSSEEAKQAARSYEVELEAIRKAQEVKKEMKQAAVKE